MSNTKDSIQAKLIKNILQKRKINKTCLAKELGISPSLISHILSGRRRFGINTAMRISAITGLTLEQIYKGSK